MFDRVLNIPLEATAHRYSKDQVFLQNTCARLLVFIKLFPASVSFLYPLKMSEHWFSDVFRGYRNGTWA